MLLPAHISKKIEKRKYENAFRSLTNTLSIDFSSNDFLGLSKNELLLNAVKNKIHDLDQIGSQGSRLLSGNSKKAQELEYKLAAVFKSENTLLFNSGYTANISLLSSIATKNDTIIYDEKAHASIKDGARLSHSKKYSFKHNLAQDLELKIKKSIGNVFVVVESIYSMDGDFCEIESILEICKKYNAYLIIDEAHSTGIYGGNNEGWIAEKRLENEVFARVFTFGKALGTSGACIAGSQQLIEYLINFARPFIYSTAPSFLSLISIDSSLDFIKADEQLKLFNNIKYFKSKVQTNSKTAIQPIRISGNENVKKIVDNIRKYNIDVKPILSPTVLKGEERIRVCLHSFNSKEEIDLLSSLI